MREFILTTLDSHLRAQSGPASGALASLSLFPSGAARSLDKEFQRSCLLLIGVCKDVGENCDSEWW